MTLPHSGSESSSELVAGEFGLHNSQPAHQDAVSISTMFVQGQGGGSSVEVVSGIDKEADSSSRAAMSGNSLSSPPRTFLPPFSSRRHSHLPTPQSPNSISQYVGTNSYSPESPAPQGSQAPFSLVPLPFPQRYPSSPSGEEMALPPPSRSRQIMTPDSSPLAHRSSPTPRSSGPSRFNPPSSAAIAPRVVTAHSNIKSESPLPTALAPPLQISSSAPSPDGTSQSRLSSPFMARLSLSERSLATSASPLRSQPPTSPLIHHRPVHVNDLFTAEPRASVSTPPRPSSSLHGSNGGEMDRIRLQTLQEERAQFQAAESRRPEYLKRAKRPLSEVDPTTNQGNDPEDHESGMPSVGITVSPNKGRRLKLFQETSEESFEESLMAGGYGRYRTSDWLQQPMPGPPGPSNLIPVLEAEAAPTEKEAKKRKRLAAFRDSVRPTLPVTKLHPVEVEGKGRILLDASSEEHIVQSDTPTKKRGPRRKKKAVVIERPTKDRAAAVPETDLEKPNWPDTEFPWSVRVGEHAELARAEEEERLRWIEKFLDRDSDEEDDDDEAMLPSVVGGKVYDEPPVPSRRGRGKMVPLRVDSNLRSGSRRRHSAFFPSDPADARAALLSKKSVRALSFRTQQRRIRREDYDGESDEEVVCICRGRDDGRELVQCDGCQTWYHLQCIGIRNIAELGDEEDPWFCSECQGLPQSRTPTPELAPSSEPTFVPTEPQPSGSVPPDPLFFQGSLQDSPIPSWSTVQPPKTPTRGRDASGGFSSGSSWNAGPSTPNYTSHGVRVYTTPGSLDSYGHDELPFDPTSTPSRGIKASFTTPKNMWSTRANGLFQTPSRPPGPGASSRARSGGSFSTSDGSGGTEPSFNPYRSALSYDDSPIRRTKSSDASQAFLGRRIAEPSIGSRMTALTRPPLEESPVVHSMPSKAEEYPRDMYDGQHHQ